MGIKDTKIHLCAINLVFPTKPCIIAFRLAAFVTPYNKIYNLCLFCMFFAIRLTLHYLFTPAYRKKKKEK